MKEYIEDLTRVINSLNRIQVSGSSNLSYLLGSIQTLTNLVDAMNTKLSIMTSTTEPETYEDN